MHLQFLEFDGSEDADGVVCWDALAQPAARHTHALLIEVSHVLAWAHQWSACKPGALEDGADWDFDLRIHLANAALHVHWDAAGETLAVSPFPTDGDEITLSLSISGVPVFAGAFREHWNAP